jgi:predicted dehydrogenase
MRSRQSEVSTAVVVGLGAAGGRHARVLRRLLPASNIVGVSRSASSNEHCDEVVGSVEQALERRVPQLAIIASPATQHVDDALPFIAAGVPLLIEKPLAADVATALRLKTAVGDDGPLVAVGYNLRRTGVVTEVLSRLSAGDIGALHSVSLSVGQDLRLWRPGRPREESISAKASTGGGALLELSHEIDLALLFGGPADELVADIRRVGDFVIDVEDVADLLIRHRNGVRTHVHLDLVSPGHRRMHLLGDAGEMEADLLSGEIQTRHAAGTSSLRAGPTVADSYEHQLLGFLAALSRNEAFSPGLEEGLDVLRIIEMARATPSDQPYRRKGLLT